MTGVAARVYLDANASEPLRPEARAAMCAALDVVGNPASVHAEGRAARRLLEQAREALAARFNAPPAGVVFCSGGTEANLLAVRGLASGRRLLIGATEHDAVRAAAPDATVLQVLPSGTVDLAALEVELSRGPALVCLMHANNETGVLHPIAAASALCRAHGALLHVDAAQSAGRGGFDMAALGAHSIALSAHKLGGPKGAGALLLTEEATHALRPPMQGGGQERGLRGGTPNLAAIAGFAAAATLRPPDVVALRDAIEAAAARCGARVAGAAAPRLPNTSCLVLPGVPAQTQLMALDLAGIAVSAGAACSSGKVAASHVLIAMGFGDAAGQAIRVSLPWNAEASCVPAFAEAYAAVTARARRVA